MTAERDGFGITAFPLAFSTRNGIALDNAGVFRDAEGHWWSIQARKVRDLRNVHSVRQDNFGRVGHISFVRLSRRPEWLTANDKSNLQVALELNQMLYKGNVKTFRTQDEADEAFKEAHEGRNLFVR